MIEWWLVPSSRTNFFVDMLGQIHPDANNCWQNNCQEINAMLQPNQNFELRDESSGLAG